MRTATIGHFASRQIVTAEAETTVLNALKIMSERKISCLVILSHGEPVGIITERDVVFAANWVLGQPDLSLREVMSKPVMTASETTSIEEAYQIFREHQIRHLVVLNSRMELAGVFTQSDLVRAMKKSAFVDLPEISLLMSEQVLQVEPQVSARYALSLMARHAISGVVIVDAGEPVGIFTERDVVRLVADGVDLTETQVHEVMSSPVISVKPDLSPQKAIECMQDKAVRRLLVMNDQGALAGIITRTDISRAIEHKGEPLTSYLPETDSLQTGFQPSAF